MKQCSRCKETKPKSEFGKNKSKSDGLHSYCNICNVEYSKKYRENNRDAVLERNKKYRENNREQIVESLKKYRENNREKIAERNKKYYENNREPIVESFKKYYENNREPIIERGKKYRENNREQIIERGKKCRAELLDSYVKTKLKIKHPPKELIEFKRDQLKLDRLIKKFTKELENEQQ